MKKKCRTTYLWGEKFFKIGITKFCKNFLWEMSDKGAGEGNYNTIKYDEMYCKDMLIV